MERISINRQSSIRLDGEKTLYFDPWDVKDFSGDADLIFITHDHFDHYSAPDIMKLKKAGTVVVVPAGFAKKVKEETGAEVLSVEPGKQYTAAGISFETVAAYNVNKKFHPKKSGYCGYAVSMGGKRWYVMGDSDVTDETAQVQCDVLFLPIGGHYTMDYNEAVPLVKKIAPLVVIPTHYGDVIGEKDFGDRFADLMAQQVPDVKVELILYQ